MSKVKALLDEYGNLSDDDRKTFGMLISILYPEASAPKPRGTARPSRRGRFACEACGEVFRTMRGLGVHTGHVHKDTESKS